jgi:hypothetical protein
LAIARRWVAPVELTTVAAESGVRARFRSAWLVSGGIVFLNRV